MKNRSMKFGSVALASVMLLSLITGCGKAPAKAPAASAAPAATAAAAAPAASAAPAKNEKVKLTLLMSNTENRDGINAVVQKMEQDLNISTEIELRPGGAEGENIVRSRLAVNEVSDINLFNSGSLMGTLNPAKNFYDLKSQPYMSTFTDAFKQTVTFDGGTYGVPLGTTLVGGWLYNKKVYNELGLKVPKTWAELIANCDKIKASGKTAVIGSFATDWTSQLILLADYYNVQATVPDFAANFNSNKAKYATTPAALRAFEKMREVKDKGYMNADYNATTLEVALKMLVDGKGVQYPMLTNQLSNIASAHGVEAVNNIGFFAQPGEDASKNGVTVWMPNSFIFYKNSPKIQSALKWAEYYVSKPAVELYNTKRTAQGPSVVKGVALPSDAFTAVKDSMVYFDAGQTAPALEFITNVKGPNSPQICISAQGGLKTAKEAAEEYDKDVEKQAKQLGLKGW